VAELWIAFNAEERLTILGQDYDARIAELQQQIRSLEREKVIHTRPSEKDAVRWRSAVNEGTRSLSSPEGFQRFVSACAQYPHWSLDNQLSLIGQTQSAIEGLKVAPQQAWRSRGYRLKRDAIDNAGIIRSRPGTFLPIFQDSQVHRVKKIGGPDLGQAWVLSEKARKKLPKNLESIARQGGVLIRSKHQVGRSSQKRPYRVDFDPESGRVGLTFLNKWAPTELPIFRAAVLQSTLKTTRDVHAVACVSRAVEEVVARAVDYRSVWKPRELKYPTHADSNEAYEIANLISINSNVMVSQIHQLSGRASKVRPKLLNPNVGLEITAEEVTEKKPFIDTSLADLVNSASSTNVATAPPASVANSPLDTDVVAVAVQQPEAEL
jgi:hypothetical protein